MIYNRREMENMGKLEHDVGHPHVSGRKSQRRILSLSIWVCPSTHVTIFCRIRIVLLSFILRVFFGLWGKILLGGVCVDVCSRIAWRRRERERVRER